MTDIRWHLRENIKKGHEEEITWNYSIWIADNAMGGNRRPRGNNWFASVSFTWTELKLVHVVHVVFRRHYSLNAFSILFHSQTRRTNWSYSGTPPPPLPPKRTYQKCSSYRRVRIKRALRYTVKDTCFTCEIKDECSLFCGHKMFWLYFSLNKYKLVKSNTHLYKPSSWIFTAKPLLTFFCNCSYICNNFKQWKPCVHLLRTKTTLLLLFFVVL